MDNVYHFVRTATGGLAYERIVIGLEKSGTGFEQRINLGVVFRLGWSLKEMSVPRETDTDPVNIITVLSVSSSEDEHAALEQAFRESEVTLYPNCRVALQRSASLKSALAALRDNPIPIVLFDGDSRPGAWREMVLGIKGLPSPPCLILTAHQADDRLWAEALSNGAFDVISKPFQKTDVVRIVTAAWRRWRHRYAQHATASEPEKPSAGS